MLYMSHHKILIELISGLTYRKTVEWSHFRRRRPPTRPIQISGEAVAKFRRFWNELENPIVKCEIELI